MLLAASDYSFDSTLTGTRAAAYTAPIANPPTSIVNSSGLSTTEVLNSAGTGAISRTLAAPLIASCNVSRALVIVGLTADRAVVAEVALNNQKLATTYNLNTNSARLAVGDVSDLVSDVAAPVSMFHVDCPQA